MVDVADDDREQETEMSLTNLARHLCKNNGVAELMKTRPSHMCYHAEFGRSAFKDAGINTVPLNTGEPSVISVMVFSFSFSYSSDLSVTVSVTVMCFFYFFQFQLQLQL